MVKLFPKASHHSDRVLAGSGLELDVHGRRLPDLDVDVFHDCIPESGGADFQRVGSHRLGREYEYPRLVRGTSLLLACAGDKRTTDASRMTAPDLSLATPRTVPVFTTVWAAETENNATHHTAAISKFKDRQNTGVGFIREPSIGCEVSGWGAYGPSKPKRQI